MDEEAGCRIASKYPDRLKAIFLHIVTSSETASKFKAPVDRLLKINGKNIPIFYYKTYVGAGLKAYKAGLIGSSALDRIVKQAKLDLNALSPLPIVATMGSISHYNIVESRWRDLERDVEKAVYTQTISNAAVYDSIRLSKTR